MSTPRYPLKSSPAYLSPVIDVLTFFFPFQKSCQFKLWCICLFWWQNNIKFWSRIQIFLMFILLNILILPTSVSCYYKEHILVHCENKEVETIAFYLFREHAVFQEKLQHTKYCLETKSLGILSLTSFKTQYAPMKACTFWVQDVEPTVKMTTRIWQH